MIQYLAAAPFSLVATAHEGKLCLVVGINVLTKVMGKVAMVCDASHPLWSHVVSSLTARSLLLWLDQGFGAETYILLPDNMLHFKQL